MVTIELIQQTNILLATTSLILGVFGVLLFIDLRTKQNFREIIEKVGMHGALFLTFFATLLTLLYSEVFGLVPCGFCWLERMMLWTQVPLVLTALYFKERFMPRHGIVLSWIGLVISLYHHYIQMGGSSFIACPSSGGDCAKRFMFEFGFVTFPLLAAILFAFLVVWYTYILKTRTNTHPTT
ncbi:MAG TPA: disulfide bond formation protein B [Candidatus Paceibacterota bacterium]|nr:disulfide bond formation protein B [Candidatus Paceibacterota bacterium]